MNYYVSCIFLLLLVAPVSADGYVIFNARGVSVQDPYIFVTPYETPMNFSFMPDHSESWLDLTNNNPHLLIIKLLTDGVSEPIHLGDGTYSAYMRQSNADQPETQYFIIGGQGTEYVSFLGAAIPTDSMGCCACHNVTVVDKEGYVVHHPEVNHTVRRASSYTEYRLVVDHPAWDETILVPPITHDVCYPEVNYTMKQSYYWTGTEWVITTHWVQKHCPAYDMIFPRKCEEKIVVVSEAYCDTIVDTPGYTRTIHHDEANHIEVITHTTEWDEIVVDAPAWDDEIGSESHEKTVCSQDEVCPCGCNRKNNEVL